MPPCEAPVPDVTRTRVPALDGLRGVAVLGVLGLHLRVPGFAGGARGVDVFFVLSGFLITSILLAPSPSTTGSAIRHFFGRRARRILPAFCVLLAFHVGLGVLQAATSTRLLSNGEVGELGRYAREAGLALTFGAFAITSSLRLLDLGGLTYTWSLAVEEQFYLVYPLVFFFVARRSKWVLGILLGLVVLAVQLQRLRLAQQYAGQLGPGQLGYFRLAFHSDVRMDGVAVGALTAVLWAGASPGLGAARITRGRWPGTLADVVGVAAAAFLVWVVSSPTGADMGFLVRWGYLATAAAAAALIVAVLLGARVVAVPLSWRPVRWVGTRSFAIYLWHIPLLYALRPVLPSSLRAAGVAVATLAVAELSYRFVEQPFLRPRRVDGASGVGGGDGGPSTPPVRSVATGAPRAGDQDAVDAR